MSEMISYKEYLSAVESALAASPMLAMQEAFPVTEPEEACPCEEIAPQPLRSAMKYSLMLPGKRLRPVLLLAAYHLLKDDWHEVLDFACALEMIHTYSLIHDDLPAMDNDDLRRGQPTNHRVFGEDIAILAGDGLLNLAYETMLNSEFTLRDPAHAVNAMREIARRAGVTGMVAGQTLDVKLEGQIYSEEKLMYIHRHKTADLLTAPLTAGLMLAGASDEQLDAARQLGLSLGLAFQIQDDILDIEGDATLLGKNTGMDAQLSKMTWPALYGLEQSKKDVADLSQRAKDAAGVFGDRGEFLKLLADSLINRNH